MANEWENSGAGQDVLNAWYWFRATVAPNLANQVQVFDLFANWPLGG